MSVTYTLQEDNAIRIDYDGVSDKKTVINVTNHSYFNLGGHDSGSICDERIRIDADGFTEILPGAIPTGKILPVEGTPMDLRALKRVGDEVDADFEQLTLVQGYDHNWVLKNHGKLEQIAQVEDDRSSITMEVYTDLPVCSSMQATVSLHRKEKTEFFIDKRPALCLETQYFPNSVNIPAFEQPVFDAGEHCKSTTIYKFR